MYYNRLIKDFYTIINLVVYTSYTKVIHLVVAIPTITIGDEARAWLYYSLYKSRCYSMLYYSFIVSTYYYGFPL
jgi:hypothetical protein